MKYNITEEHIKFAGEEGILEKNETFDDFSDIDMAMFATLWQAKKDSGIL